MLCYRCEILFRQALCLTQVPECNPALTPPAANYLRLCNNQSCFDFYKDLVSTCSVIGANVTEHLANAATQDMFCPGYVSGTCKDVPGAVYAAVNCSAACSSECSTICSVALHTSYRDISLTTLHAHKYNNIPLAKCTHPPDIIIIVHKNSVRS